MYGSKTNWKLKNSNGKSLNVSEFVENGQKLSKWQAWTYTTQWHGMTAVCKKKEKSERNLALLLVSAVVWLCIICTCFIACLMILLLIKVTFYQVFVVVALVIIAMCESRLVATWDITREPNLQLMQPAPDKQANTCTVSPSFTTYSTYSRRQYTTLLEKLQLQNSRPRPSLWECIIWLGTQKCCLSLHFCSSLIPLLLSLNVKSLFFKPCTTASTASVLVGFACSLPVSSLYSCFLKSTRLDDIFNVTVLQWTVQL